MSSVTDRFGPHAQQPWTPVFKSSFSSRRALGMAPTGPDTLQALALFYKVPGDWPSVHQSTLATILGVSRQTVAGRLRRLRDAGLIATRPDPRYGHPSRTLRFNLSPYFSADALLRSDLVPDPLEMTELICYAHDNLQQLAEDAAKGVWNWRFGRFRSVIGEPPAEIVSEFVRMYGLPTLRDGALGRASECSNGCAPLMRLEPARVVTGVGLRPARFVCPLCFFESDALRALTEARTQIELAVSSK